MSAQPVGPDLGKDILKRVDEEMTVYDLDNNKIGSVDFVYLGEVDETAEETGRGAATGSQPGSRWEESVVDVLATVFDAGDDLPDVLRNRLEREGFIRVEGAGLLARDRYILPDQIASVEGDRVLLNVTRDQLIKK